MATHKNTNFVFSNFNIELQVLIRAGQTALDKSKQHNLEEILNDEIINWDRVYELSCIHQIRPLLLKGISSLKSFNIPQHILLKLKTDCINIAQKNLSNTTELLRIINLFKENGITVIPYKGAYFASQYYGDLGLREFSDIDLFVEEADIDKIKEIMKTEGYKSPYQISGKQEVWCFKIDYDYIFNKFNKENTVLYHVEMHYKTSPRFLSIDMSIKKFPSSLKSKLFLGTPIKVLSDEAHLFFIITHHGVKESWSSLKYFFDISQILKIDNFDFDLFFQVSKKYKLEKYFLTGYFILGVLFGSLANEKVDEIIIQSPIKKVSNIVLKRINRDLLIKSVSTKFWYGFSARLIFDRRPKIIINYLSHFIIPTKPDFDFIKNENAPVFLYYFIRPYRIITELFNKK